MLRTHSTCSACNKLKDKVAVFPNKLLGQKLPDFEICGECLMAGILDIECPVRKQQKFLEVEGQLHDDTYVECHRYLSVYDIQRLLPGYWDYRANQDEWGSEGGFCQTWQENEKGQRLKAVHYQVPSTITLTKYEVDDVSQNPGPGA